MKIEINKLSEIARARIIAYLELDSLSTATQLTRHVVNSSVREDFFGLGICQYNGEIDYYLFYCDSDWNDVADTWHSDIASAKSQASAEFDDLFDALKSK